MIKGKKGFEFSFGWIFAIIVGSAILAIGIYGAVKLIDISKYQQQTFAGKELGIILNPVEAGLSDSQITSIVFPVRTRVINDCDLSGDFGKQLISTSIQSEVGSEWEKPSAKSAFYNKYIFSEETIEGNNMIAFSKSFDFPFKVADVVYIYSVDSKYCFVNPPNSIKEDIESLKMPNINVTDNEKNCLKSSKKVCFFGTSCDINVNLAGQFVRKYNQNLYYFEDKENTLLYGAIFSDPILYECQTKRLMKRTSQLSLLYLKKSLAISSIGCNSGMESDLNLFYNKTNSVNSSINIRDIQMYSLNLEDKNRALVCKLF